MVGACLVVGLLQDVTPLLTLSHWMLGQQLLLDNPASSHTLGVLLVVGNLRDLVDHLLLADEAALGAGCSSLLSNIIIS